MVYMETWIPSIYPSHVSIYIYIHKYTIHGPSGRCSLFYDDAESPESARKSMLVEVRGPSTATLTHGIPWFLGILAFDTKIQAAVEDGCVQESKIHRTLIACDVQGINM